MSPLMLNVLLAILTSERNLTSDNINCMVFMRESLAYQYMPDEQEIERMSEEVEDITLSHPELFWVPIEVQPCDTKVVRSFEKGASNGS